MIICGLQLSSRMRVLNINAQIRIVSSPLVQGCCVFSRNMVRSPPTLAITDVSPVLKKVLHERKEIFDSTELTAAPVAQFYDLDLWDAHLEHCAAAFGETVHHFIAIKSNSITRMLKYALDTHGFGVECASIGEVLHAMNHCRIPCDKIVFDSPCKTVSELQFAIQHKIHCNLDNFDEYERAVAIVAANGGLETGGIGMRINPLVGAGTIAALSVSTSDSKFGVAISEKDRSAPFFTLGLVLQARLQTRIAPFCRSMR